MKSLTTLCAALAIAFVPTLFAQADLVKLRNGGELRGSIISNGTDESQPVTVETLTGAIVSVARDEVLFVTFRSPEVEEYETEAKSIPHTIEAHWNLAEWCRENGLGDQRDEQLELLLQLNPEHRKAHFGLGHTQHNGEWMTRDELMTSKGYIKHKGKYVTKQELELLEKSDDQLEAEKAWYKKVKLWTNWLTGRDPKRHLQGLENLRAITDPAAIPALAKSLQGHTAPQLRSLFMDILSTMEGKSPVQPLVLSSLLDVDYQLRFKALSSINEAQYDEAIPRYIEALDDDSNDVVRRAGYSLGKIGDEKAIPFLIEALVTTHRVKVLVPAGKSISVAADGSGLSQGGAVLPPGVELALRTGQLPYGATVQVQQLPGAEMRTKTITVKQEQHNKEVLAALNKITGENLGYDQRTWKLWLAALKTKKQAPAE